ncbi:MAG: ETX/MTX2 family pore-forming toxin [Spiroplasma phoeniceum]|nr:MAG: ETX/MTX2 family pore-forming toxin [Spiroplasma phoeniceum]UZQ32779.1 MAG: ETX/MTX2 family pore-forming toxin [Spiroplasma phoeniceum]
MKKLLSLLTVLTISGTAVPTTIAASPYQKEEKLNSNINYFSQTNSLDNLSRGKRSFSWIKDRKVNFEDILAYMILHKKFNKNFKYPVSFKTNMKDSVKKLQDEIYNNKTGLLKINNKERLNLQSSKIWGHTFTNSSDKEQVFSTQAYEKIVTNTNKWNINISLKESLKFDFFVGEGSVEFTISGGYEKTETKTETLKLPSQNFKVKPNSTADVNIVLEKATYKSTGLVTFEVDMNKVLDLGPYTIKYIDEDDRIEEKNGTLTIRELIDVLWENNYNQYLKYNNNTDSIFTVDNIDNPTKAYFNIPITWNWTGNNLIVNFSN